MFLKETNTGIMMFLILMMIDGIPITTQIGTGKQVSKNKPNVGVCLNIK